ncbi:spherulin-1A [Colletotrichum nymphaeae SA-01]|uniref:Spherulin-1A n=1 Tax=Colletotrichum nymphaeae SA-01 TaxID=1460502 RepID=A0A135UBA8_9PEZI|nr:spherulin-1A [Colletotrichum nymphaeae SA-01]
MLTKFFNVLFIAGIALAVDKPVKPEINAKLKTTATELEKLQLVKDDYVFDFKKHEYFTYSPGGVVNANAANFPAATGHGLTIAWLALGPCAMLPPHHHPRATNFVVAVEGQTQTWMVQENGADPVTTTLNPGQLTIFPRGSLHTMQNPGCGNATLISALDSDDTGTLNILNSLFKLPNDMVQAAFGGVSGSNSTEGNGSRVPIVGTGAALGSEECLARCGMGKH